jgi:hypothetical protein
LALATLANRRRLEHARTHGLPVEPSFRSL